MNHLNRITTEEELESFWIENKKLVNLIFEKYKCRSITKKSADELRDELKRKVKIVKDIKIINGDVYVITDKLYLFCIGLIKLKDDIIINDGSYKLYISHNDYLISNKNLNGIKISDEVYYLEDLEWMK